MIRAAVLVALAACTAGHAEPAPRPAGKPAPRPAPSPDPTAERFEHDMLVRMHMHENFGLLHAIERLLIRGKLDDARRLAESIGAAGDGPSHGPWAAHAVAVRERATELARAPSIDVACRRAGAVAAACAGCHAELDAMPELRPPSATPPDRPTIEARMLRHRWASDRLWEGLVTNGDDAWRSGLDILAAAPLDWAAIAPASRAGLARQLQQQAARARRQAPDGIRERAAAYGEMLATCAGCHTARP